MTLHETMLAKVETGVEAGLSPEALFGLCAEMCVEDRRDLRLLGPTLRAVDAYKAGERLTKAMRDRIDHESRLTLQREREKGRAA